MLLVREPGCVAGACARVCCRAAGETEEQFEATCALVREVGFDRVNTAAYSPRPATPAAEWDNQVQHLIQGSSYAETKYQAPYPSCSLRGAVLLRRPGLAWDICSSESA